MPLTISSNPSGSGTFTVQNPASASNRTLTLPDQTATLATIADVNAAAAAVEGMTLLGTLTTTSGSSQSLTGLSLTSYKQLVFDINGVSGSTSGMSLSIGSGVISSSLAAADVINGMVFLSLWSGVAFPILTRASLPSVSSGLISQTGYSTATTTVAVSISPGNFDLGSIRVYGVK